MAPYVDGGLMKWDDASGSWVFDYDALNKWIADNMPDVPPVVPDVPDVPDIPSPGAQPRNGNGDGDEPYVPYAGGDVPLTDKPGFSDDPRLAGPPAPADMPPPRDVPGIPRPPAPTVADPGAAGFEAPPTVPNPK